VLEETSLCIIETVYSWRRESIRVSMELNYLGAYDERPSRTKTVLFNHGATRTSIFKKTKTKKRSNREKEIADINTPTYTPLLQHSLRP